MSNIVVGYARISTGDQTLNLQLDALEKAGCHKIFTDQCSGAKDKRPGLDAALDQLRPGDTLVVWKLDRLGRSAQKLVTLMNEFNDDNICFKSLTDGIDTTTSMGKLIYTIMAAFAENERNLIVERTRAGINAARARGNVGGRPEILAKTDIPIFKSMFMNREITIRHIAEYFKMSPSCVYYTATKLGVSSSQRKLPNETSIIDINPSALAS
jgi:DNA invertase Pin-like site-specific DNA recombinase